MPRLSQFMIRTALLWLGLGSTAGGLLLANKGVPLLASLWALRDLHIHVLLVGWTAQLACGVAFWILPRLDAQGSRGDERFVWACFILLNAGVVAAVLRSLIWIIENDDIVWLNAVAGLLYVAATLAFARNAWPRVVPFRTLPRPSREQ